MRCNFIVGCHVLQYNLNVELLIQGAKGAASTGRLPCLEPDDLMMYMSNGPTRASELNLTGERISCEFTGVNSTFCEVNILKAPDKIGVIIEKNDLSLEFRNS